MSCPYPFMTSTISLKSHADNAVHTNALVPASNLHFSQNHILERKYKSAKAPHHAHKFTAVFMSPARLERNSELSMAAFTKSWVHGNSELISKMLGTCSAISTIFSEISGAIHKFFHTIAASHKRAVFVHKFQIALVFVVKDVHIPFSVPQKVDDDELGVIVTFFI